MAVNLIPTVNSNRKSNEQEELEQISLESGEVSGNNIDYGSEFSPFIVYVDESGTANFDKPGASNDFPIFVLAFCIFYKHVYASQLVPEIQALKFEFFGHDLVIFHEKEIRKKEGPFKFKNREMENQFMLKLNQIMQNTKFILVATAIKKNELQHSKENLYHKALEPCLVNLYKLMIEKSCQNQKTFVVVESRGNKEDKDLELEFRRICDGNNGLKAVLPFEILIKKKETNATGLQFADLCARPIGRHILDRSKPDYRGNRAFDSLRLKFLTQNGRDSLGEEEKYLNYGLTVIPKIEKAEGL
ncbi:MULTISPECIES: DUF3800 domain-containing protein [unclassified Neisseria]|uniref:DUF3800 domain-containing protein n=1 Tax=unclassified Neisseria TaxID=2623750 RepID=UPI00266620E5|nr:MULTISPECIES: DUF3800 domain-containing protein [unclassified Neisseria]MDO1510966.1 DUF3800 domain-containing protein [Neisseria sp. MVDL19-042950]MDO1517225.1 DUF3800 domain-containing protein [Neisseria sp. MVDL18-041461]MDO1564588.1 DUF3800 domain-containing protein [Neisseria sp. MVDL20-010259]